MHIIIIHDRECPHGRSDIVSVLMTDDKALNRATVERAWESVPDEATLDDLYAELASAGHTFDVLDDYPANHVYLSGI